MIKAAIALGVTTLGATALGCVAYLQMNRFAFTSHTDPAEQAPPAEPPSKAIDSPKPRAASPKIALDELVVQVKTTRPRSATIKRPSIKRTPPTPKLVPCSPWRALGPVATSKDGTVKQRRVQMLCTPDSKLKQDFDPRGYRSAGHLEVAPKRDRER